MQRKLTSKPQDVPGINQRPTANASQQQVAGFVQTGECSRQPIGLLPANRLLSGHNPAGDPGQRPGTCSRHQPRQPFSRLRPTHAGKHRCQRHALHLASTAARQQGIDVPANPAERLPQACCLGLQPSPVPCWQPGHQPPIEAVTIAGNPGQQFGQWHPCLWCPRPPARQARGHQHHASQHGGRLFPQFSQRNLSTVCIGP